MHCKNISLAVQSPPLWKPHNKSQKRRGVQPYQPISHRMLNIHPMKEVLRKEGRSGTEGAQRALSICRGHFHTYTPEKPLFGKPGLAGSFWIPMHTRGGAKDEQTLEPQKYKVYPK